MRTGEQVEGCGAGDEVVWFMVDGGGEEDEEGARSEGVGGIGGEIEKRGSIPLDFQLYSRHSRF